MNWFKFLDCPATAMLDLERLKKNYQSLAAEHHPDQGGDEAVFKQVNEAYQTLRHTHSRLKHLIAISGIEFSARGAVSNEVMDYFMPTGELIQSIDSHLSQVSAAGSALQKAMLTPKTMELQSQVEAMIDSLDQQESQIEDMLVDITTETILAHSETVTTAARDLTFLTKWKAELRERFAKLFC